MKGPRTKKTYAIIRKDKMVIEEKEIYSKADLKEIKKGKDEKIALIEIKFIKFIAL